VDGAVADAGRIYPYEEAVRQAKSNLQKGMSYRPRGKSSIFVMSRRKGAPYVDELGDDGRSLIYQGHNIRKIPNGPDPNDVDQPLVQEDGEKPSDNAKFLNLATAARRGEPPEPIEVWEKIDRGIWLYKGVFELVDAWEDSDGRRRIFKFKLNGQSELGGDTKDLEHARLIPSQVKAEVWKRDGGRCVLCGATTNLHYDHDLPFSKGGTSLLPSNIKILCAKHNLSKGAKII
jgi:hypothetical protein